MKMRFRIIILMVTMLPTITSYAQQLYKCSTEKSFWTFSSDSSFFSVRISGNAQETDRKSVIAVGSNVLQNLVIDKTKYVNAGEDNSELNLLIQYALAESEYLSGVFKTKLEIKMQKMPLSADKSVLIWSFELPAGVSEEVKSQLFANVIHGNKIVGFSSSQFANQKFESVRDFLMDIISTIKVAKTSDGFGALCDK